MKLKRIDKVKTEAEARQIAIDWQRDFVGKTMYWSEAREEAEYFAELAEKFNLTEEFKENGII